jgi:hypothetical protein
MNNKNDNKVKDEINIGVGCLPYFLFYIILVGIRFFLAKGKTWETGFVDFLEFIYWVGVGYMVITIIINKSNEQSKRSRDEILNLSTRNNLISKVKKTEPPKVQSIVAKKVNVENKIMSNDNLFNKIGNAKWIMSDINGSSYPLVEVEFCKDGKFIYKNLPCKWMGQNDNIEIHINRGFVILKGELINNVLIVGKSKNYKSEWDFEIKLDRFYLNPVNPIISEDLIGSKWKIEHSSYVYDDAICEFLNNNILRYRNKTDWTWNIKGDEIVLMPLNLFSTYTCKINNGKLTGNAINKNGKKWTLSGEIIKNVSSTAVNLPSNEPPPRSLNELIEELNIYESNTEEFFSANVDISRKDEIENNFSIESDNNIAPYNWHALWKYFPKNRFPDDKLNSIDLKHRLMIFEFKDGHNPEKYAKIISEALIQKFGKILLETKTLLIVPASNKTKTDIRFMLFCEKVAITTGMINGYYLLTNNDRAKIPKRLGGENDIIPYIKLNSSINGKDFIIIDDIRTSGKSSNDVNQLLKENGAKSTIFIYFGRTVSNNTIRTSSNIIEVDDLPF